MTQGEDADPIRPRQTRGLAAIVDDFDALLVDQFGVIHDGRNPYPGAAEALDRLGQLGKRVVLLTNSGQRSSANVDRLVSLGFARHLFQDVVSSGEVTWRRIRDGSLGFPFVTGQRVCVIGRPGDDYGLAGLGVATVPAPEQADFLLIAGSDAPNMTMAGYEQILRPAAHAGVPALCSNPDRLMLTAHGTQPAPGAIAGLYAGLGGAVTFVGKPHPAIYRHALKSLASVPKSRILVVGDSLEHDIRGGAEAGLRTALVLTGVAADTALTTWRAVPGGRDHRPDFILPAFRWD